MKTEYLSMSKKSLLRGKNKMMDKFNESKIQIFKSESVAFQDIGAFLVPIIAVNRSGNCRMISWYKNRTHRK